MTDPSQLERAINAQPGDTFSASNGKFEVIEITPVRVWVKYSFKTGSGSGYDFIPADEWEARVRSMFELGRTFTPVKTL